VGSQVSADRDATLQAERDINLVGSGISAGRDVNLNAGRDVNVVAAQKLEKASVIGSSPNRRGLVYPVMLTASRSLPVPIVVPRRTG